MGVVRGGCRSCLQYTFRIYVMSNVVRTLTSISHVSLWAIVARLSALELHRAMMSLYEGSAAYLVSEIHLLGNHGKLQARG